ADAAPYRNAAAPVDADPFHAAARRVLLEDVSRERLARELLDAGGGEPGHRRRVVGPRARRDEPGRVGVAFEPDRLARDPETELDLRADRDPLDERCQRVREEPVALVAAVPADLLPEETGADADTKPHAALVKRGGTLRNARVSASRRRRRRRAGGFAPPRPG